jgi:hypothetical protein
VEKSVRLASSAFALAVTMAAAPSVYAAGFGDMFNPGRWFGGNNDDDYYYDGPYGGAYGPGLYGAPGYGPYGAPGYGYGYGAVPYGYAPGLTPGVAPGYVAPVVVAPATIAPATGTVDAKDQEIEALKRRIEQLETARQSAPPPTRATDGWPAAPAFRPMDQY